MNEQVSVETPEQIDIKFQQAGIGSRFYAALIDTVLLTLISLVGYYVNKRFISELGDIVGNWLGAVGGVIVFALFWGYYMVSEVTTNGQTFGKRALGLRVIKEGGYPLGFADSAIRNLVRIVDFLPFFYGVGLLCMLMNRNWQRLGDLAAGTIVIKTERTALRLTGAGSQTDRSSISIPPREFVYTTWIQPTLVTETEMAVIREYLARRATLPGPRRLELARVIASPIVERMGGTGFIGYDRFWRRSTCLKPRGRLKAARKTRMDPSQVNSVMGIDLRSDSKNKYPKLHAMGFAELLDETFSLYRAHFRAFVSIASGYSIAMLVGISIVFFDDSAGRTEKMVIWIPTFVVIFGSFVFIMMKISRTVNYLRERNPTRFRLF